MVPVLFGRLQTRLFVTTVVGGLWTLLISPFLPGLPDGAAMGDVYEMTFQILAIVLGCGLVWECMYHALQQLRWEKDWPTMFGLLEGINEGIVAWVVASALLDVVPGRAFAVHFATTWLVTWAFINGPMRIIFIRWRFQGGRIV